MFSLHLTVSDVYYFKEEQIYLLNRNVYLYRNLATLTVSFTCPICSFMYSFTFSTQFIQV